MPTKAGRLRTREGYCHACGRKLDERNRLGFCGVICSMGWYGGWTIDKIDRVRNEIHAEMGLPPLEPR